MINEKLCSSEQVRAGRCLEYLWEDFGLSLQLFFLSLTGFQLAKRRGELSMQEMTFLFLFLHSCVSWLMQKKGGIKMCPRQPHNRCYYWFYNVRPFILTYWLKHWRHDSGAIYCEWKLKITSCHSRLKSEEIEQDSTLYKCPHRQPGNNHSTDEAEARSCFLLHFTMWRNLIQNGGKRSEKERPTVFQLPLI